MQLNLQLIKQLRTERGWTQQQLAEICAISLRTVQRVEMQGVGSLETCNALAAAFELERSLLLVQPSATTGQKRLQIRSQYWIAAAFLAGLSAGIGLTLLLAG